MRRRSLAGSGRRLPAPVGHRPDLGDDRGGHGDREEHHPRQCCAKIVGRQTQRAGMRRQALVVRCAMLDGMRPRRQLGKAEEYDEQEMAQRIHGGS